MRRVEDTCQDFCCGEVSSWTCQRTSIVLPPCKENNGQCISTIVLWYLLFSNMSFGSVIASRKEVFPCVTFFWNLCCIKSYCNIHQHYYALQCTLSPFAIYINMHRNAPVLQVVVKVPGSESKRVELALFERMIIIWWEMWWLVGNT